MKLTGMDYTGSLFLPPDEMEQSCSELLEYSLFDSHGGRVV